MIIEDMASLHRDEASYIFNNNRLLVGWLERVNQRTEAWLGKVLSSGGAGRGTGWWRIYTSPNGSELLTMAMSQLHPALQTHSVGENVKAYFSMSTMEQVTFLAGRYYDVVVGRAKYSEHEGGELKTMTNVGMVLHGNVGNAPQRQKQDGSEKRKRDSSSFEDSAKEKKAKLYPGYYNDSNKADDEKPLPCVNRVSTEMSAIHHIPTVLGAANLDAQQHGPLHSQSQDQISASIANLDLAENVVSSVYKPADQNRDPRGAVKPDHGALTTLAHSLQKVLVYQVIKWAKCGDRLKRDLKEPARELCVAENLLGGERKDSATPDQLP